MTDKYSGSRKTGLQQEENYDEENYDVWSVQRVYRKRAALRPLVAYRRRERVRLQRESNMVDVGVSAMFMEKREIIDGLEVWCAEG